MKYLLFPVLCLLALSSTTSRLDGIIQNNMQYYAAEFKGATFTPTCTTGYFDREYNIAYRNRKIAQMICIDDWINPTCHIDYEYGHPSMRTMAHVLAQPWDDSKFAFIRTKRTADKLLRYFENCDVQEFMYMDKVLGGTPWPIKMLQEAVESGYKTSGLASRANNRFGIKCFNHSKKTHLAWANLANGKARYAITAKGDTTCIWVGKDDHHHDHFRYFSSSLEGRQAHEKVLQKERFAYFTSLPFNYDKVEFTVRIYGAEVDAPRKWIDGKEYIQHQGKWDVIKKVFYEGAEFKHGDRIYCTNIDAWFIGLSAGGYATDPYYADKLGLRFFTAFGDKDEAWFKEQEDYYLGLHYDLPQWKEEV